MVEKDKLDWCYYFKIIDRWIRVCSKDMNEGFSVFTRQTRVKEHYKKIADSGNKNIFPVLAAAINKSVCLHKNAGICKTST